MKIYYKMIAIFITVMLISPLSLDMVQAQDERGESGGGSVHEDDGGDDDDEVDPFSIKCAGLTGQVTTWGGGPQSGYVMQLKSGSWDTSAITGNNGEFNFIGLGKGIANLHLQISPDDTREVLLQDAGVYLDCDLPVVANVAIYSGKRVTPPAHIKMEDSKLSIQPDEVEKIKFSINNDLPTPISKVMVTSITPKGLTALGLSSSIDPKVARIIDAGEDGQMVVMYWDELESEAEVDVELTVEATDKLSRQSGVIRHKVSLLYSESVADQAWVDFSVGKKTTEKKVVEVSTKSEDDSAEDEAEIPMGTASDKADDDVPPNKPPTTGSDLLSDDETSNSTSDTVQLVEKSSSDDKVDKPAKIVKATTDEDSQEAIGSNAKTDDDEDEAVPPSDIPDTGMDMLPSNLLPVTGFTELPATGIGWLLPLSGLALGSLAFAAHRLRNRD